MSWRTQAACRHTDLDVFYPAQGDLGASQRAKAICAVCPVCDVCLAEHLWEEHGVFGGTSPQERRSLRKTRHVPQRQLAAWEHDLLVRRYRRGVPPVELAREFGVSRRHVHRLAAEAEGVAV